MPDRPIMFDDLVRGEITFAEAHVADFVLVRANGYPLYPLVNPVDDALMGITHVLRGEDLLPSTPRQIALYEALADIGVAEAGPPVRAPAVRDGRRQQRLSKRDTGSLGEYMECGFLPEGLLNYLALLGWSIADDRDVFTMDEMIKAFDIRKVNSNAARFDLKKCEAINAAHMRVLPADEFGSRMIPFLAAAGLLAEPHLGRAARRAAGRRTAGAGADEHAVRGGRHARVPVRRRGRVHGRPDAAAKG